MEDEVPYSTVVFTRFDDSQRRAADPVEEVLYSEIKRHGEKPPSQSIPEPTVEAAASRTPSYRTAIACLGLLCVLLLAGVVGMSVFNIIQVSQHRTTLELYTNESTAHSKLKTETAALEKEKEELTVQRDQFNNTLRSIIQFPTFPVRAFCQIRDGEIHCEPCMMNWIQNGSSCYLFYNGYDWKSWENSRQYCVGMGGDLAIIDSREEQEFIMQNSPFYYDIYHGYWIGLYKNPEVWKWTTGTKLNDGFWIKPPNPSDYSCGMVKPSSNALNSWAPTYCGMKNKWICEMSAVEWPDKL
ncbi:C-type lectin domain family 9 member A isoform X2 [Astyanax mexicanus]|uniref:C-type lectin domain family 9 member A isoform X2 n=1 Tax=Astyanax mexicanus TaxID=7994 RepID=UPI0020CAA952|nr:C-type lectin domain family 9 member A isoform X2 [Astyanax mexicanus]